MGQTTDTAKAQVAEAIERADALIQRLQACPAVFIPRETHSLLAEANNALFVARVTAAAKSEVNKAEVVARVLAEAEVQIAAFAVSVDSAERRSRWLRWIEADEESIVGKTDTLPDGRVVPQKSLLERWGMVVALIGMLTLIGLLL